MKHQIDHGHVNHGFTAGGQRFVVQAQPTVLAEPSKRPLDNPPFRQDHEPVEVPAFDNLNGASALTTGPVHKRTRIRPIGPDPSQPSKTPTHAFQHLRRPVAVLDIGRMHRHRQDQAERVYKDVTFTPFDLLASVVPALPPFPVLTVWLSRIAALGVGLRPAFCRTCSRSRS